jgi:hypothetical protein
MRRTGGDIMEVSGTILSKTPGRMTLEAQLIQAHVKLQFAARGEDDSRTATLVRHGAYEVRLVEPSHASPAGRVLFWIELFDHDRRRSIDSVGSYILEDAVIAAEQLVVQAKKQGEDPDQS